MSFPSRNPDMYHTFVEIEGVKLHVDPINRKRSDENDNAMAIFYEEQPLTWEFIQPYVKRALSDSPGSIDFLDVGCGSGFFGLLFAKNYGGRIVALDKNKRAVGITRKNMQENGLSLELQHELYSPKSVPESSAKVIGIYPPYHLYPESLSHKIPQHARGGSDGQGEFRNQLGIASGHLADKGILFFNQMCLGNEEGPAYLEYVPKIFSERVSVIYSNVFPAMDTKEFLEEIYSGRHRDYVEQTARNNPILYYTVGIMRNDELGKVEEVAHNIDLKGRSWNDRVNLHREIALHEFK